MSAPVSPFPPTPEPVRRCKHDVSEDCPACAEETIAGLKARVEELEAMLRRMVVEFTDHHYPGCPKEASDAAQCECFAGNLVEDARALQSSTLAVSR